MNTIINNALNRWAGINILCYFAVAVCLFSLSSWSFITIALTLIVQAILMLVLLYYKKWRSLTITMIAGFVVYGGVTLWFISIFSIFYPYDNFSDDLDIPPGIAISEPKGQWSDNVRPDSILKLKRTKADFELYNGMQPGIYEYDVWLPKIDSGTVYLKMYEVTQNYRLSKHDVKETEVRVGNTTDSLLRFGTKDDFMISEGDWGEPYAARFEIWYRPDHGKERKLLQKNYKLEGWQR